MFTELNAGRAE